MKGVKSNDEPVEKLSPLDQEIREIKAQLKEGEYSHFVFKDGRQCLFSRPDRKTVSMAMSKQEFDPLGPVDVFLANCWLAGDESIKEDVRCQVFLNTRVQNIIGVVSADLKN